MIRRGCRSSTATRSRILSALSRSIRPAAQLVSLPCWTGAAKPFSASSPKRVMRLTDSGFRCTLAGSALGCTCRRTMIWRCCRCAAIHGFTTRLLGQITKGIKVFSLAALRLIVSSMDSGGLKRPESAERVADAPKMGAAQLAVILAKHGLKHIYGKSHGTL